mmetsp:Transcript_6800/g.41503  ORF Transcript_6800/g.41503 Transcript_6800/m.41503 type:complete len:96 (-) Transcript_6800:123-410(-)
MPFEAYANTCRRVLRVPALAVLPKLDKKYVPIACFADRTSLVYTLKMRWCSGNPCVPSPSLMTWCTMGTINVNYLLLLHDTHGFKVCPTPDSSAW